MGSYAPFPLMLSLSKDVRERVGVRGIPYLHSGQHAED